MITIRHQIASRAKSSKFPVAMLTDTHPDAEAVQFELLRRMTTAQKFELTCALTDMAIDQTRRAIERRHPGISQREVDLKFIELSYGADLAEKVRLYLKERGDD